MITTDQRTKLTAIAHRRAQLLEDARYDDELFSDYDSRLTLWTAERRYQQACDKLTSHILDLQEAGILRIIK